MEGLLKKLFKKTTLVLICFLFFSLLGLKAQAAGAVLYLSPSSGSFNIDKTFSVSVYVSSTEENMNAVSGVISFPNDKLEATAISKSGSIISLWVQEPSINNNIGRVNFEAIVLNPGFIGSEGKILTVSFKVKTAGIAKLAFSSGSILANDGLGTNILSSFGNAQFTLGGETPPPPVRETGLAKAPIITSSTHPDQNKWYVNNNPIFAWALPTGTTGVSILVDNNSSSNPGPLSDGIFKEYSYDDVGDGIWYFHIRLLNSAGWGDITHYRFQIDTENPDNFEISEIERKNLTNPEVKFILTATDKLSGIDHYEVQVDDSEVQIWNDDGSHIYTTFIPMAGEYTLFVKAIDKAGNFLANSDKFTIEMLEPPVITEYPKEMLTSDTLIVKGTTYPTSLVTIWLQRESEKPQSYKIDCNQEGKFVFTAEEKLKQGSYKMWAEVTNQEGASSKLSEKLTISVVSVSFWKITSWPQNFLIIILILIIIIIILMALLWRNKNRTVNKISLRKEIREVEQYLHKSLRVLNMDITHQIKLLDKTKVKDNLTKDEIKVVKKLTKKLNNTEKVVKKEIEDVKKLLG